MGLKKITFSLFVSLMGAIFSSAYSQAYKPVIGTTNTWDVLECAYRGFDTRSWFLAEDSVYKGLNYQVYRSKVSWDNKKYGLVREDTMTRKIYAIPKSDTSEWLIYDFDVVVGDTLVLLSDPMNHIADTSILDTLILDTTFTDTSFHSNKILRFHHLNDSSKLTFWLEGVGSLSGFSHNTEIWAFEKDTFPISDLPITIGDGSFIAWDGGYCWGLLCASKDGNKQFELPVTPNYYVSNNNTLYYDSCYMDYFIGLEEQLKERIKVYPNPFRDAFTIELKNYSFYLMEIYNAQGQLLFSNEMMKSAYAIKVDALDECPQGLYYLILRSEKGVLSINLLKN